MPSLVRAALWAALQVSCLCLAAPAAAQTDVEQARAHYDEADFDAALRALSRAFVSDRLDAELIVEALRIRALVHLGMGDLDAMREDVRDLLTIRPETRFDEATPPEVRQAADELRDEIGDGLRVRAWVDPMPGGARVAAEVSGDSGGIVESLRVHTRVGEGAWRTDAPPVELEVSGDDSLAYAADAIGPGGAILASDGTSDAPLLWSEEDGLSGGGGVSDDGGVPWLWIGIGAGAVVLGVVLVAVLAGGGGESDRTQPTLPMTVE